MLRLGVRATLRPAPLLRPMIRALSSSSQRSPQRHDIPPGSAYDVLSVSRTVDERTLRAVYKQMAVEWHPDKHQGATKEEAEQKFQEISEAFQTLVHPVRRSIYDAELDRATTAAEKETAAKKYRATSWRTEMPDIAQQLRNAKREEPGFPRHLIAGGVLLVTANFVLAFNWLAG